MNDVRLTDRFDISKSSVLLNGTQALVRLLLEQHERDRMNGLQTAGLVTGYRGSPLGALDFQMKRAARELDEADIVFQPALNEDLAATALWGSQMAELRGEGRYDGVFGLWYGKGPGVDRSGDALRHANMAGTSPNGGVVVAMGDDHTGESSTTLHQSDPALIDAYIPVLSPAGVQEVLDYGLTGFAMSRLTGNWVGLKCVKETIESTASVKASHKRVKIIVPEVNAPPGGLNIRIWDTPQEREARIIDYRRDAAETFARVNKINRRVHGRAGARVGFVAAGKSWLDLIQALSMLGIEEDEMTGLGLSTYKVGMVWPLDRAGMLEFIQDMELVILVEEKRKIIESQVKDLLYNQSTRPAVIGNRTEDGRLLFTEKYELDPVSIARALGRILIERGMDHDRVHQRLEILDGSGHAANSPDLLERVPYFCSGCPHNTSTRIPDGARAYAGIGCHYMVQWMDRDTLGFTHMGGEGANWIGEAPFSTREHIFQNIGDGTYNHSGLMAIRAAVAADANMTFKVLFNDAVAMTGGQANDGSLTPLRLVRELDAMGVGSIACVHDGKEAGFASAMPSNVTVHERSELDSVQRRLQETPGVSALVYCQTCAAEKRRRRKRGTFPVINRRVFINPDICEGCGDCGIQSNCLSIVPLDTEFGMKRAIDQSSCNMDLRCLDGFCPSFVSVTGTKPRKQRARELVIPEMPDAELPVIDGTYQLVISGVGGTGIVTIGAVLAMAAHLDGLGIGMIEMAGLAQKGGAVVIHCRIARNQDDISAIRVAGGGADSIIAGDLVLAASSEILGLCATGVTSTVVNDRRIITGEFTRDPDYVFPADELRQRITAAVGSEATKFVNATWLANRMLGDAIYSNMIMLGSAWQMGSVPVSREAICQAIDLNGASARENRQAFELGRMIASGLVDDLPANSPEARAGIEARQHEREQHLAEYQGSVLVDHYRSFVEKFRNTPVHEQVVISYHRLLAIKDEYEVARLHLKTRQMVNEEFEDGFRISYHLSPPFLAPKGLDGRPVKVRLGGWVHGLFAILAGCRRIRGTVIDPFRFLPERKLQRTLIKCYARDMEFLLEHGFGTSEDAAIELASLPQQIRGYGPVWMENYKIAMERRSTLIREIEPATHH